MARIELEVSGPVIFTLFDSKGLLPGRTRTVPGGALLTLESIPEENRAYTAFWRVQVEFPFPGATREFAAWLYDQLKNRGLRRIRINRKELEVTGAAITRAVLDAVEMDRER